MRSLLAALLFAAAVPGAPRPTPTAGPTDFPVELSTPDGSVTAVFQGTKPDVPAALYYGTESLAFRFKGDPQLYPFKPEGTLYFSDWRFDLFSPDGKWVLLLQDHYGPYHVVAVAKLKDYLLGKAKPDKVEGFLPQGSEAALVHKDARWLSAREFEYVVAGETPTTRKATVP